MRSAPLPAFAERMQLPSPYLTSAKQETPHVDAKVPDTGGEGAPLAATSSLMLGTGFLHELTDHLPVSVMVLEITELRVAYLNQRVEQEFDVRPRALLGRRITRALKGMVPVDVESVLWRAVRERRAVEHEFTLAQRKRHRIVNARFLATYDGCGYPTALIVIARDVSAERRAQRELAESRLRFQEFAAAVDDGVFVASLRRDSYHYVSPRMFELFDLPQGEVGPNGQAFFERVLPEDRQLYLERFDLERERDLVDVVFRINHPRHGVRWLRSRTRARTASDGEPCVYGLISDVTDEREHSMELQRARDSAEAASRAKSQFMANMSHEIRTPMNGILGMTELLLGTPLTDKQRRFAQAVYRSGESLLEIINDILDFSKIEAGRLELAPCDFNLRTVVEDTLELLAPRAHEKRVELNFREERGVPALVHADPLRLRQVLTNLIANAIKFTESGEVVVDLRRVPGHRAGEDGVLLLQFKVRDTGIGIEPDVLPRLFNAFTQAHGGMSRRYGGTGLGLAISKQLVELMNGEIEASSKPGVGSCFSFTVPVREASDGLQAALSDTTAVPAMRVLVVDDHETNRVVLENMLGAWGLKVVLAENGLRALDILRGMTPIDRNFDLALVDMHMPGLDGLALMRTLREEGLDARLKLIMLSSVCAPDGARAALAAGFHRFVNKPLRKIELRQAILGIAQPGEAHGGLTPPLSHRILVIEDNPVNQEVVTQMLCSLGCRVTVTGSALDGLKALCGHRFELVLMDIQMPGMDGTEALHWFRRGPNEKFKFVTPPGTPVVAVTANALGGDEERFLAAGFDDYLSKPFRQSQLHAMLRRRLPPVSCAEPAEGYGAAGRAPVVPAAPEDGDGMARLVAVLDAEALQRLRELDPSGANGLLARVLKAFDSSLKRLLLQLHQAREGGDTDTDTLRHVAHTLKSSSASIGALHLSKLCADIERRIRQGDTEGLDELLDGIVSESDRLLAVLRPVLEP